MGNLNYLDEVVYFDNQDELLFDNSKSENELFSITENANQNLSIFNAGDFSARIELNGEIVRTVSVINSLLKNLLMCTNVISIDELILDNVDDEFYCKIGNKDKFIKLARKISLFDKYMNEINVIIER